MINLKIACHVIVPTLGIVFRFTLGHLLILFRRFIAGMLLNQILNGDNETPMTFNKCLMRIFLSSTVFHITQWIPVDVFASVLLHQRLHLLLLHRITQRCHHHHHHYLLQQFKSKCEDYAPLAKAVKDKIILPKERRLLQKKKTIPARI